MNATICSTDKITTVNGQPCRLWRGTTYCGVDFLAYISLVRVSQGANVEQFERELKEVHPSGVGIPDVIDLRFVL